MICPLWVKAEIGEGAIDVRFTPKANIDRGAIHLQ